MNRETQRPSRPAVSVGGNEREKPLPPPQPVKAEGVRRDDVLTTPRKELPEDVATAAMQLAGLFSSAPHRCIYKPTKAYEVAGGRVKENEALRRDWHYEESEGDGWRKIAKPKYHESLQKDFRGRVDSVRQEITQDRRIDHEIDINDNNYTLEKPGMITRARGLVAYTTTESEAKPTGVLNMFTAPVNYHIFTVVVEPTTDIKAVDQPIKSPPRYAGMIHSFALSREDKDSAEKILRECPSAAAYVFGAADQDVLAHTHKGFIQPMLEAKGAAGQLIGFYNPVDLDDHASIQETIAAMKKDTRKQLK